MATPEEIDQFYLLLGARVKEARRRKSLSQAALAERLGLTRASIANLEAGRQRPSAHLSAMISTVLDVPVQELLSQAPAAVDPLQKARDSLRAQARSWAGVSS